jgi:trans-2-enoyl-CoA reductase
VYKQLPSLPAVGGNEGVFEVLAVGPSSAGGSALKAGDWVIPRRQLLGTWASHAVWSSDACDRVRRAAPSASAPLSAEEEVACAATVAVNPCTAWRMLHDFVELKPGNWPWLCTPSPSPFAPTNQHTTTHVCLALRTGDIVLQNAGTSAVAQAVAQLSKHLQLRTITVVRSRADAAQTQALKEWALGLGSAAVLTEEELDKREPLSQALKAIGGGAPRLALNAVGGTSATNLLRALQYVRSIACLDHGVRGRR